MSKIIDYDVITSNVDDFNEKVKQKISEGWVPQGSVSSNVHGFLMQAMVRYGVEIDNRSGNIAQWGYVRIEHLDGVRKIINWLSFLKIVTNGEDHLTIDFVRGSNIFTLIIFRKGKGNIITLFDRDNDKYFDLKIDEQVKIIESLKKEGLTFN